MDKWDYRFDRLVHEVADWSKDPGEQVGALLVSPDRRQVSWGFNGFPRGIEDDEDRLTDTVTKNRITIHAEMNVLLNAAVDVRDWTLYVTKFPCCSKGCAQAIIQKGIARVLAPEPVINSRWYMDQLAAQDLLKEAGVEVIHV